jgi:hypothetical protein
MNGFSSREHLMCYPVETGLRVETDVGGVSTHLPRYPFFGKTHKEILIMVRPSRGEILPDVDEEFVSGFAAAKQPMFAHLRPFWLKNADANQGNPQFL